MTTSHDVSPLKVATVDDKPELNGWRPPPRVVYAMPWEVFTASSRERLRRMCFMMQGKSLGRLALGPYVYWVVNDPESVKHVVQENAKNYRKGANYDELKPFLGQGLFTSEGDFWRRQRRLAQPAFHHKRLAMLATTMAEEATGLVQRWSTAAKNGDVIDVAPEMMRITLTVVSRTLFGVDLGTDAGEFGSTLTYVLRATDRRLNAIVRLPRAWPLPGNQKYAKAIRTLDGYINNIISRRRELLKDPNRTTEHHDLLAMFLEARDEDTGEGMTDQQLRDEVITIVLAGHETTALALSWALYELAKHPAIYRAVRDEARAVLGDRDATWEDFPKLQLTNRVVQEALRMYPPVWIFERQSINDDVIDGVKVPANSTVAISTYTMHHDPRYWDQPEGFDPDRFLPENAEKRHKFAFLPFGGGPRICIGNQFALCEAAIILATIARTYNMQLDPTQIPEPEVALTLRPGPGGIRMYPRKW